MNKFCNPINFQEKIFSSPQKCQSSSTGTNYTSSTKYEGDEKSEYLINQYVVNLDWFQCTLRGFALEKELEDYVKGDFCLIKRLSKTGTTGNQNYRTTYNVFYRSKLFGRLVANPRSTKIIKDETMGQFVAENEELYREGFLRRFKEFLETWSLGFNNYTRVDIAVDFPDGGQLLRFMQQVQSGETPYELLGRQKLLNIKSNNGSLTGFQLGMSTSGKMITCYNKSEEIREKKHKPYIVDTWVSSGVCKSAKQHDMTRLEIRLKRDELEKYGVEMGKGNERWRLSRKEELDRYGEPELGFSQLSYHYFQRVPRMLSMFFDGFFEFAIKSKDQNKARWVRKKVIDFSGLKRPALLVKRGVSPMKDRTISYKRFMKKNYAVYIETGDSDYLYNMVKLAIRTGFVDWVFKKLEYWYGDIGEEITNRETNEIPRFKATLEKAGLIRREIERHAEIERKAKEEFDLASERALDDLLREHDHYFWPSNTGKATNRYHTGFHRDIEYIDHEQPPF